MPGGQIRLRTIVSLMRRPMTSRPLSLSLEAAWTRCQSPPAENRPLPPLPSQGRPLCLAAPAKFRTWRRLGRPRVSCGSRLCPPPCSSSMCVFFVVGTASEIQRGPKNFHRIEKPVAKWIFAEKILLPVHGTCLNEGEVTPRTLFRAVCDQWLYVREGPTRSGISKQLVLQRRGETERREPPFRKLRKSETREKHWSDTGFVCESIRRGVPELPLGAGLLRGPRRAALAEAAWPSLSCRAQPGQAGGLAVQRPPKHHPSRCGPRQGRKGDRGGAERGHPCVFTSPGDTPLALRRRRKCSRRRRH